MLLDRCPRTWGNGRLRHRHLPLLTFWCVAGQLAVTGCAATREMNAIKAHVERMTQDIGALQVAFTAASRPAAET